MNIEDKINKLKKIQRVDAPPFLLTRITQQLKNQENESASVQWKLAFAVSAIIIFTFNAAIFFSHGNTEKKGNINTVVNTMNLFNKNELYNE